MRQLLTEDGNIQQVDRVCAALVETGKSLGRNGVAAFEAIRDTVDGKPSSDNEGSTGPAIIMNTVFIGSDEDD